jgi:hypothetical protein
MDRSAPKVTVRPIPIKRAILFVREVHRRLPAIQGGMWAIAAEIEGETVGVIIVGHPQARMACDGVSLEVTRCAVREGARNASSALYGAAARAAKAMGALDFWTTIHGDESGHSLKAAGWVHVGECGGGEWNRDGRQRKLALDPLPKQKWSAPWGRLAIGHTKSV